MAVKTSFSTDKELKALKPASKVYDVRDENSRNVVVRVSPKGKKTFCLVARYPGSPHPTRARLGTYPDLSLEEAHERARDWRAAIDIGVDPRPKKQAKPEPEEPEPEVHTFRSVAETYVARKVSQQRRSYNTEREIRNELIAVLGDKPIGDVSHKDIAALVEAIVDRGAPYTAHIVLGHLKTLYSWAFNRGVYDLEYVPTDRLKPKELIGAKRPRQRTLNDAELRAFWAATGRMEYPWRELYRMLLLTGGRKAEVAEARWREIDLAARMWTIPSARFKSDRQHHVPLSGDVVALLDGLPRHETGDLLFSYNGGRSAPKNFAAAKRKLDALMAEELGRELEPWVNHDLRRSCRTRLSDLGVPEDVAEVTIGHELRGLSKVYNQSKFMPQRREALEAWAAKLREIVVGPPPEPERADNVVRIGTDWDREVQHLVEKVKANHPGADEERVRRALIDSGA